MTTIKRALISTSDKTGLAPLALKLAQHGVEILSTGGTARYLKEQGVVVVDVSQFTGFPEMLDGRVKTLHPKIHGGLLAVRDNPSHQQQMVDHGLENIDMVIVNLYPFEACVAKQGCTLDHAIENIDIGGPSMVRSAAKNYRSVAVVMDPEDYPILMEEMDQGEGKLSLERRFYLAKKAFARTSAYDAAISNWLSSLDADNTPQSFPEVLTVQFNKRQAMRYGENPHQEAAFYVDPGKPVKNSLADAYQIQGKELSFNNIHDANGALMLVSEFEDPAVAVIKHANPCGASVHTDLLTAYQRARDCDPTSAFGGIIACNQRVNGALAREIVSIFVEAVIAPDFSEEALSVFASKKNLRVLRTTPSEREFTLSSTPWMEMDMKRVKGGLLLQQLDSRLLLEKDIKVVSKRKPTEMEMRDLMFGWKVVKYVKSNAIVYVRDLVTVGVGAGQMSRVDASRIAILKAQDVAREAGRSDTEAVLGSVVASDAFFPFADGVEAAAKAGATAVIQPGGSIRDDEVIAAADAHGLAMLFTGVRHFRH